MQEKINKFAGRLVAIGDICSKRNAATYMDDAENHVLAAQKMLSELNSLSAGATQNLVEKLQGICFEIIFKYASFVLFNDDKGFINTPRNINFVQQQLLRFKEYPQYSMAYQKGLELLMDHYSKNIKNYFNLINNEFAKNKPLINQKFLKFLVEDKSAALANLQRAFHKAATSAERNAIFNEINAKYVDYFRTGMPAFGRTIENYNSIIELYTRYLAAKSQNAIAEMARPVADNANTVAPVATTAVKKSLTPSKRKLKELSGIPEDKSSKVTALINSGPLGLNNKVGPNIARLSEELSKKGLQIKSEELNKNGLKIKLVMK